MKRYRIIIMIFFLLTHVIFGSSLLKNYKTQIQNKIDQNISIQLSTFTDFIDSFEKRLEDESQKFMGFKPYIESVITFVKNISLEQSKIDENTISGYGQSFTISASIKMGNHDVPLRFTVVSNVNDIELYSVAMGIPDDVKIADLATFEMQIFDTFFKNRWIVFTLFDYRDPSLGMVYKGLNIVADADTQAIGNSIMPQLEWLQNLVNYTIPSIRFTTSIPLAILGLIPYFAGRSLPEGITFEALHSLIRLKAVIGVNKTLYRSNKNSGITEIIIDSCDMSGRWGSGAGMQDIGLNISTLFSFDFGVTTRIKSAMGAEIVAYGGVEINPIATVLHGKVDGEIKNPFGIPWLSLYNIGFDFPLTVAGIGIMGVGVRGQAGIGKSRFEIAGKAELGILKKSGLTLHGQVEKIPFSAFTQFIRDNNQTFGWLKGLELDHAQVTIACGDTTIAQREFKSGITVRAQVQHPGSNKKAGFQVYAYNTGTYYQFFGNGYLPEVNTRFITFKGMHQEGPRLEFNYAFDFAFERFLQAIIKANGNVKIGSFFEGVADIDISTITLARNAIMDWKNFLVALLREQKVIVKGKLFNTFSAELCIIEEKRDNDIYVEIAFSQKLLSAWEKTMRSVIAQMKDLIQKKIESIDQEIKKLTLAMDNNAKDALERATDLAEENEVLRRANSEIQDRIKKIPWKELYKVIPLRAKQGYNATIIASNADLLNTIMMHGAFTQATASTFSQLRRAKSSALVVVDTIATVAKLGAGALGIERIEAHGKLDQLMHQRSPLLLTITLKVMGKERTISNIPFDGTTPIDSARNLIRTITSEIMGENVSQEVPIEISENSYKEEDVQLQNKLIKGYGESTQEKHFNEIQNYPIHEKTEENQDEDKDGSDKGNQVTTEEKKRNDTEDQNNVQEPVMQGKNDDRQKQELQFIEKLNASLHKERVTPLALPSPSTKNSWTKWFNERGNLLVGGMQLGTAAAAVATIYLFYKNRLLGLQNKK